MTSKHSFSLVGLVVLSLTVACGSDDDAQGSAGSGGTSGAPSAGAPAAGNVTGGSAAGGEQAIAGADSAGAADAGAMVGAAGESIGGSLNEGGNSGVSGASNSAGAANLGGSSGNPGTAGNAGGGAGTATSVGGTAGAGDGANFGGGGGTVGSGGSGGTVGSGGSAGTAGGVGGTGGVGGSLQSSATATCDASGWCWFDPLPLKLELEGGYALSATDVWGAGRGLAHFDGTHWTKVELTGSPFFYGMHGTSSTDIWATGTQIVHWDGLAWTDMNPGVFAAAVWADAPGDAWLVSNKELLHWHDSSWSSFATPTESSKGIWAPNSSEAWVAVSPSDVPPTAGGSILHFDSGGWHTSYTSTTGVAPSSVWGTSNTDIWAAGDQGVLHYNGSAWSVAYTTTATLRSIWGTGPNKVWAVGTAPDGATKGSGASVAVFWDGATWTQSVIPNMRNYWVGPGGSLFSLTGSSDNELWAFGLQNVAHFDGTQWSAVGKQAAVSVLGSGASFFDLSIGAAGLDDFWIFGPNYLQAAVLQWNGSAWSSLSPSFWYEGNGPFTQGGSSQNNLWLPRPQLNLSSELLAHWNGSAWQDTPPSGSDVFTIVGPSSVFARLDVISVWSGKDNDVWITGQGSTAQINSTVTVTFVAHWDGVSTTIRALSSVGKTPVWASSSSDAYLANGSVLHWDGTDWAPVSSGMTGVSQVVGTASNDVWAIGDGGVSHWNGSAWSVVPMQATLSDPIPSGGLPLLTSAPSVIFPISPASVWLGLGSGGALHFDGSAWSPSATLGEVVQQFAANAHAVYGLTSNGVLRYQ